MLEPVRIFSDLHLGHRVSRITSVAALRPLIAGAGTVIFNGDTWQELAKPFRERSGKLLDELKQLCAEEGAESVFLSGNHDPGWPGKGWVELNDGKILVTHGDAVLFDGSPWSREAIHRQARIQQLWREHHAAHDDAAERLQLAREIARNLVPPVFPKGKKLWQRIWEAVHPPQRAIQMLLAWFGMAGAAAGFAQHYFPRAEVFIFGHFHRPGIWRRGNKLILNSGAFLPPSPAYWIEWHKGWLSCGKIEENADAFTRGAPIAQWRFH